MIEPKFKRPAKTADGWPGVFNVLKIHPESTYPWRFQCPQPLCFMVIHAATEKLINERVEKHTCPWFGGGTTTFSWGVMSDDYLTPIWQKLDRAVDKIKQPNATEYDRALARGLAEALAILMPPFFTTGDEIVKEALVRWERRQAGLEYETPGIGRFKWNTPPGMTQDPSNPAWFIEHEKNRPKPAKPAPKHNLKDADVAAIKAAATFPPEILSAAYGVSPEVIKYIQEN